VVPVQVHRVIGGGPVDKCGPHQIPLGHHEHGHPWVGSAVDGPLVADPPVLKADLAVHLDAEVAVEPAVRVDGRRGCGAVGQQVEIRAAGTAGRRRGRVAEQQPDAVTQTGQRDRSGRHGEPQVVPAACGQQK
jgi:hypothetical protein